MNPNNPTFVIGHHGHEYFTTSTQDTLGHFFGGKQVNLYLCGHSHRPGYHRFDQPKYALPQITCGGGLLDTYSVFSFMHGHYDCAADTIIIKPYSYAERGNHDWHFDGSLHHRLDGKTPIKLAIKRAESVKPPHPRNEPAPQPPPAGTEPGEPEFPGFSVNDLPIDNFPINNLHKRNTHFTGHEDMLAKISFGLRGASTVIVTGQGGFGKTQTAIEYAYKNASSYECAWLLNAESKLRL
jgi:hypothetical protein